MPAVNPDNLMSITKFAEFMQVHPTTVKACIEAGKIETVLIGYRKFINVDLYKDYSFDKPGRPAIPLEKQVQELKNRVAKLEKRVLAEPDNS